MILQFGELNFFINQFGSLRQNIFKLKKNSEPPVSSDQWILFNNTWSDTNIWLDTDVWKD